MEISRVINSTPAKIFRSLTTPTNLTEWLCSEPLFEARVGGQVYLYWQSPKYSIMGELLEFNANQSLALRWQTSDDPMPQSVRVELTESIDSTKVAFLFERPITAQLESLLTRGLAVLDSMQTTGFHLNAFERPLLGVVINGLVNPENAARLGLPIDYGVILGGTIPGYSAEAAQIQPGDVMTALNGEALKDFAILGEVMRPKQVGDRLELEFYRGAEKHTSQIVLKPRVLPDLPNTLAELAELVCQERPLIEQELIALMDGVSAEHANKRPSQNAWSANHVLSHLILAEREYQTFVAGLVVGVQLRTFSSNLDARVEALLLRHPNTHALLEELQQTNLETKQMIARLPESFYQQKSYLARMLLNAETYTSHPRQHIEQIKRALAAARAD